jgi:predicted transcriptional regulator
MKSLTDLNDQLFNQLDRLSNTALTGDALAEEIRRSEAVVEVSTQIISNGNLVLRAKVAAEERVHGGKLPAMLECASAEKPQ